MLAVACQAVPALAEPVSSLDLENHNLTDEEIRERCAAAIRAQYEMVTTPEGRRITGCEHTYETARAAARAYRSAEQAEAKRISQGKKACDTQADCLEAGQEASESAEAAHAALEKNAAEGEQALAQLVGEE